MLRKLIRLTKREIGDQAEAIACSYLKKQGLSLITTNFNSRLGEIDLIMRDAVNDNTVFIEVRYRKNDNYGGAAVSVTPQKQKKIIQTALLYMQKYSPDTAARFDVIAIEGDLNGAYEINWIVDAFQAY